MVAWPPDGLWRVVSNPGDDGLFVSLAYGGTYDQPPPQGLVNTTIYPLIVRENFSAPFGTTQNVWTPAVGQRFNLLGWQVVVTGNNTRAAAAQTHFFFQDGGVNIGMGFAAFIPAAAGTTMGNDVVAGPVYYACPYRSLAINNVLSFNAGSAISTGGISCHVWGFETP